MPDTILLIPLDEDTLAGEEMVLPPDSSLQADTMETIQPDTLPAVDGMDSWRFSALEIRGSLYQTLGSLEGVNSDILGAHCVRYLVWEMNPWTGFIAGDSLLILFDTQVSHRENMVMAFEYKPVSGSSNHPFSGYVYTRTGDNWPSVWKPDGTELVRLLDRMPIRTFEEITSVYGEPRGFQYHAGVDYKAPQGTPVYTVTGGRVVRTNWNTSYNGLCVELDYGGYAELFLHLHTIHDGIVPGALLEPGNQIGTVGNTGVSTAPHLHYQVNDQQGQSIDPYLFFSSHRRTLPESDMAEFLRLVDACRSMMGR